MKKVIVDGYNVLHAWPPLKRRMVSPEGLGQAIAEFLRQLALYQSFTGTEVTVVFDGKNPHGGGREDRLEGVRVFYSGGRHTADGLIERLVYEGKEGGEIAVATSDREHGTAVLGFGAFLVSAGEFERVVGDAVAEARRGFGRHAG